MSKVDNINHITAKVLERYRNSIPRKAFIDAMNEVIEEVVESPLVETGEPVPGLQIIKSPYATAGELADLLSGACPPFRTSGEVDCRNVHCRDCWASWLTTGKPPKFDGKEERP